MNVSWKKIEQSTNYSVSRNGQVRNDKTGRILNHRKLGDFRSVHLTVLSMRPNGLQKVYRSFYVHRLVAEAFIPNPNNYRLVKHHDGDNTNNVVKNLYWAEDLGNFKLWGMPKPVRIVETGKEFPSINQLAKYLGATHQAVSAVLNPNQYNKSLYGYHFEYVN